MGGSCPRPAAVPGARSRSLAAGLISGRSSPSTSRAPAEDAHCGSTPGRHASGYAPPPPSTTSGMPWDTVHNYRGLIRLALVGSPGWGRGSSRTGVVRWWCPPGSAPVGRRPRRRTLPCRASFDPPAPTSVMRSRPRVSASRQRRAAQLLPDASHGPRQPPNLKSSERLCRPTSTSAPTDRVSNRCPEARR
jgi:hypothetical protein